MEKSSPAQPHDFEKVEQETLEYLKTGKYQRDTPYFLTVGLPAGEFDKEFNQFNAKRWFCAGSAVLFDHKDKDIFIFSGLPPEDNWMCTIPKNWLDHHLSEIPPETMVDWK